MPKVLFVCIHNTARSVIAEAIFNSLSKNCVAESAGLEKADKIDENVKMILEKRGLKAKEKPRSLDEVDLNEYDYIVTVCDETCFLNANECWAVENPVGKSLDVYERVFEEIYERVEDLVRRLGC